MHYVNAVITRNDPRWDGKFKKWGVYIYEVNPKDGSAISSLRTNMMRLAEVFPYVKSCYALIEHQTQVTIHDHDGARLMTVTCLEDEITAILKYE